MTYCDYAEFPLMCKPKPEAYERGSRPLPFLVVHKLTASSDAQRRNNRQE